MDVAALTHDVLDQLSPSPSLAHMKALIRAAAAGIDPSGHDGELSEVVAQRMRQLRRQYYLRGPLARAARGGWRELRRRLRAQRSEP